MLRRCLVTGMQVVNSLLRASGRDPRRTDVVRAAAVDASVTGQLRAGAAVVASVVVKTVARKPTVEMRSAYRFMCVCI